MRAVVLAGGKGARLAPYTTVLPKPLMPVDDLPILEIVLRQLKVAGVANVTLAVGHLASLLEAYFGNGDRLGLSIGYSLEQEPLGTAGPLALIPPPHEPFFVMNGDVLTDIDFREMYRRHVDDRAALTVAVFGRRVKIDLGVLEISDDSRVTNYIEKPSFDYNVSMGIYVMSPAVLDFVPAGRPWDLPDLVLALLAEQKRVVAYQHRGYWLDIGRPDDYAQATEEFNRNRQRFLP